MKKLNKARLFFGIPALLTMVLSFYYFGEICYYYLFTYYRIPENLISTITARQNVAGARMLYREKSTGADDSFVVSIVLDNGSSLEVRGVDKHGRGDIRIHCIDDYAVSYFTRHENAAGRETDLQLWSAVTGAELESVTDIIENFDIINLFMKNLPVRAGYHFFDRDVFFDDRSRFSGNIITVEGEEYFFLPVSSTWQSRAPAKLEEVNFNKISRFFCGSLVCFVKTAKISVIVRSLRLLFY